MERREYCGRREGGRSSPLSSSVVDSSESRLLISFNIWGWEISGREGGREGKRTLGLVGEDVGSCVPVYDTSGEGPSHDT